MRKNIPLPCVSLVKRNPDRESYEIYIKKTPQEIKEEAFIKYYFLKLINNHKEGYMINDFSVSYERTSSDLSILREKPIPEVYTHKQDSDLVGKSYNKTGKTYVKTYPYPVRSLYVDVVLNPNERKRMIVQGDGVDADGIFDTGAQSVCVKKSFAEKMRWSKVGSAKVSGAVSTTEADIYLGDITIKFDDGDNFRVKGIHVWGVDMPGEINVLVGQPIISLGRFVVRKGFTGVVFDLVHDVEDR